MTRYSFLLVIALAALPCHRAEAGEPCRVLLNGSGEIPLNMDWKYTRGQNPEARQAELDDSLWPVIAPPFRWSALGSYRGEIWMRCRLILAGPRPGQAFLRMEQAGDAFEVFFNGAPVGRNGSVLPFVAGPGRPRYLSLPASLWKEENVLAIRVTGTTPLSGMRTAPVFQYDGTSVARSDRLRALALAAGILFVALGLVLGLRGAVTERLRENTLFAAFVLLFGLTLSLRGAGMEWFDSFPVSFTLETAIGILLPPLFVESLLAWTPGNRGRPLRVLEIGAGIFLILVFSLLAIPPSLQPLAFKGAAWGTIAFLLLFLLAAGHFIKGHSQLLKERLQRSRGEQQQTEQDSPKVDEIIHNVQGEFDAHLAALTATLKTGKKGNGKTILSSRRTPLERWMEDAILIDELYEGTFQPVQARFSIREHVLSSAEEATEQTGERPNRFQFFLPPESERFWSDTRLVQACLFHLMENALMYSNGKIEVRAERRGVRLHFRIRDEGPGIAADLQNRIFQPFVRGPGTAYPGSGMGLTLVDQAVTALGGRLHFESGHGFFTLIEIDLPEMQEPNL